MRELGIGEGAPRHEIGAGRTTGEEHVAHGPHRCVSGGVGEPVAVGDVADRVHGAERRARALVDDHATTGAGADVDAELVETEAVDVRATPRRHHDRGRGDLAFAVGVRTRNATDPSAARSTATGVASSQHVDALVAQHAGEDRHEALLVLCAAGVVPACDQRGGDAEPDEGLRESRRPSARRRARSRSPAGGRGRTGCRR